MGAGPHAHKGELGEKSGCGAGPSAGPRGWKQVEAEHVVRQPSRRLPPTCPVASAVLTAGVVWEGSEHFTEDGNCPRGSGLPAPQGGHFLESGQRPRCGGALPFWSPSPRCWCKELGRGQHVCVCDRDGAQLRDAAPAPDDPAGQPHDVSLGERTRAPTQRAGASPGAYCSGSSRGTTRPFGGGRRASAGLTSQTREAGGPSSGRGVIPDSDAATALGRARGQTDTPNSTYQFPKYKPPWSLSQILV